MQRKDLTYMYRWSNCYGERKTIYANTLNELRSQEKQIRRETDIGISRSNVTLNEQIDRYLKTKNNLAVSTLWNYRYYWEKEVKDTIGRKK